VLLSVTILSETFESGSLATNGWTVGDSNPSGTPAYWNIVADTFGYGGTHGGTRKAYCAGTGYGGNTLNPTYQNDMTAWMSCTIDLTNYVAATLTYWHLMASTEPGVDIGRVYIDSTVVGSRSVTLTQWTQQTVDLEVFLGGIHTLKIEFTSNSSTTAEGWYLDDILVTGEEDPDDTIGEATGLGAVGASPISVTGQSIIVGTDVDMYSFTVAAGQRVAFDVDKPAAGGLNSFLRLYDASGTALTGNDNQVGPAPEADAAEAYFEYTFATSGTYYVAVSGSGNTAYDPLTGAGDAAGSVGGYSLTLTDLGPEPAGTIGLAMNLGTLLAGGSLRRSDSLNPANDVDMYSFTVAAGQRVGFDTDLLSVWAPDTYLRLFDAAGTPLTVNDDGTGFGLELGAGGSYLEYTFMTGGTYYVGVSGAPNSAYDPLTGAGVSGGNTGWYDLTIRDLGRLVGHIVWAGGARVSVYDCDVTNDITLDDVAVVFKAPNAISSITLVGAAQKTGLGIAVSGADAVGKVSDKRALPTDLAFFICDRPVASLALRSGITGFDLNGIPVGGISRFSPDIDFDGDTADRTALHIQGTVAKLALTGNLTGDAIIQGDLTSAKITGSIAADVRVTGSIPKPSVTGNWAGAIEANLLGSPKIAGTLSGTLLVTGVDAKGLSIGKLAAGRIGNLVVNATGGVSGIQAAGWADGSLTAPWLSSLTLTGDCGADMTLGFLGNQAIGKATVTGTLQDVLWRTWSSVGSLTVGRWGAGSILAAGVDAGGDTAFFTADDVGIVGTSVGKLTINAYDTAHGHDFGILAHLYLSGKLAGITPPLPFTNGQFRIVELD